MKIALKYSGKVIWCTPYTTKVEKEILIFNELSETPDIDGVLNILDGYIEGDKENLSYNEKLAVLFKLRALSIGEEVGIKFKCNECQKPNDTVLNISEILIPGKEIEGIKDQFCDVTEDNLQDFVDTNVDDLDLDEFEELLGKVEESITKFELVKTVNCAVCGAKHNFDISAPEYITSALSEDSIMSLYQTTADLVFFGKYSKLDIDSMLPFERTIFVGILNKTREDLNK